MADAPTSITLITRPSDYVDLNAGNLVQLGASPSVLPRPTGILVPFIYPSILNINAGAGGVELVGGSTDPFNQLILFPSPQGSLTINTTDGGSLSAAWRLPAEVPQIFYLIVSDSGAKSTNSEFLRSNCTFGISDHAASPIHAATSTDPDNSTPIDLNISGDMSLVLSGRSRGGANQCGGQHVQLPVSGHELVRQRRDQHQCRSDRQEKHGGQQILNPHTDCGFTVGGDIINRGDFTSVTLDLSSGGCASPGHGLSFRSLWQLFGQQSSISPATLISSLYYNKDTHVLTYQNITGMSIASVLNLLQNLTIQVYEMVSPIRQQRQSDKDSAPVSVLTAATAQALLDQYNAENEASQIPDGSGPPDGTYGYTIGGGGQFNITARTIDLGTTAGIQSDGVGVPTRFAAVIRSPVCLATEACSLRRPTSPSPPPETTRGQTPPAISYGDLDMYSSSIASLQGGDITINAGGDINAGSADFSVNTTSARGIYSTDLGNVFVYANGDINVNGSRIAVYDTRQSTTMVP